MKGNLSDVPRIGASACLLGHPVRYDGGHKKNNWLTSVLSRDVEFVPVCPEMAIGLGVPRLPIQLTGTTQDIRATGVTDGSMDVTRALQTYAQQTVAVSCDLSGFIFKGESPSCGLNVKLNGMFQIEPVMGIFSRVIYDRLSLLPVIEVESLGDTDLRTNYLLRVCIYQHWQVLVAEGLLNKAIKSFHEQYRAQLLLNSSVSACEKLDMLIEEMFLDNRIDIAQKYFEGCMKLLVHSSSG